MYKKSNSATPGSAKGIKGEKTDVNLGMSTPPKGRPMPGKTSLGISPSNPKAKNVQKLSPMAKDCKRVKGSDKYS